MARRKAPGGTPAMDALAAAGVPLFAASLTPERRAALPTTRRRRRQAWADDESVMDEAGIARR